MTMWLRQSTATTIKLGVFVDDTDGKTAETALTISQADIRLSKNGGAYAQTNNSAGATHDEAGEYGIPLDTTDTNTLGRLKVRVSESGALPVWQTFMVVPANVWDSFFGADQLQVHVNEMTAGIITATVVADGTIDAATFAANAITDAVVASDVTIASVTGAVGSVTGAVGSVTGNVGGNVAGSVASVTAGVTLATDAVNAAALAANAVTEIQSGLATAASIATLQTSVDDLPTNAELATSQSAADDATLAAIAALNNLSTAQVNTEVDTALADVGLTTTITGRIDAAVSTRASATNLATLQTSVDDVPTNAELATSQAAADDATLAAITALNNLSAAQVNTEVDTAIADAALATAANLATVAGYLDTEVASILAAVDTEVAAIKVVTDALTSAAAAKLALSAGTIVVGAAAAGTLSTTAMTTNLTEATDDHLNGRIVIFTSGALQYQASDITDYNGTTKMLTYTAVTEAPTAADTFIIV